MGTPQRKIINAINITINNANVEKKAYTKYLCILTDETLTWDQHIHHVNLQLSKSIDIITTLHHLPAIKIIYYSFIQPFINYGLLNWGCATNKKLEPKKRSMDKAIRLIHCKNYDDQAIPIFNKLKVLYFDRYKIFIEGQRKVLYVASKDFTKRKPIYIYEVSKR